MATEVLRPHDCLVRPVPSFRNPNPNPRPRKRREGSPRPPAKSHRHQQQQPATTVAACHVIILKRGDPLLDANAKTTTTKKKETERKKRTGSDPAAAPVLPRQIRPVAPAGPAGDVYAGSAFSMSPSPRKVPLPSFSRRREVDRSATEDLRRLLRLD